MKRLNAYTLKRSIGHAFLHLYFIMLTMSVVLPLFFTFYNSLKTNKEYYTSPMALPTQLHWENYVSAWNKSDIGQYFFNTLFVTVTVIVISAIIAAACAFACTRLKVKLGSSVRMLFMAGLCIPSLLIIIPLFLVARQSGLVDSLWGLIIIYICQRLPFSIFVLCGFYMTVPHELEEAATIDGAGVLQTWWLVDIPLVRPGITTICVFAFTGVWNEYVIAATLLYKPEIRTLVMAVRGIMDGAQYQADWAVMYAALIIILIPCLIIFACFRKYIMTGTTAGAVKG